MDPDTVRHLARLGKLSLDEQEEERAVARIQRLLDHFAALSEIDTDDIEPSPYPLMFPHRVRTDTPTEEAGPLPTDAVLDNAPDTRGGCFRVPRAFEG